MLKVFQSQLAILMREVAVRAQLQVAGCRVCSDVGAAAGGRTAAHDVVSGFAAVGVAGENQFAFGVLRGSVESLCCRDLLCSQAVCGVTRLALQVDRIEFARHRVRDQVVRHSVERIAGAHDRLGESVLLRLRNEVLPDP